MNDIRLENTISLKYCQADVFCVNDMRTTGNLLVKYRAEYRYESKMPKMQKAYFVALVSVQSW